MKKWFRFFALSFFSDIISKEGKTRGYTNVFLGLLITLVFIWSGFVGAEMLPFEARYVSSPDFSATVHALLANPDLSKRIGIEVVDGSLVIQGRGDNTSGPLVNTIERDSDRQTYSVNGYNVIVDPRPADTLAEVEVYCISNDGRDTVITYEEYLTLSEVARLNFDFRLRYTGAELVLNDDTVAQYASYLTTLGGSVSDEAERLAADLSDGKLAKAEYNRSIYQLYFTNYYPDITEYESSSAVPLLRNYYYHHYLKVGARKYLFIFDDYMAASFETAGGGEISFYGFFGELEDGDPIPDGLDQAAAEAAADRFIMDAYAALAPMTAYAFAMNVFSLIPFIALMPMVVTLLAYSILRLGGIDSIGSLGGTFKIVGSYVWMSGAISCVLTLLLSFILQPGALSLMPLVLFFIALAARAMVFALNEARAYNEQQKQQTVQTEA